MKFLSLATLACIAAATTWHTAQASGIGGPQMLYTSSTAYCSPPEAILINTLELKFFRENNTLDFDFAAASVEKNLNVTISVDVNAYGLGLFSLSIDLCQTIPALCPLPTYNFHGRGIFPVPEQFVREIPSLAYTVPDIEALATVQLTDSHGQVVGCVQATVSNGHSAYQPAAKWAVLGLLALAVVSSVIHTILARSLGAAQWRVVDLLFTIQHIPTAALLNLNYPLVFIEFARNFAWSIGIVNIHSIQNSISSLRLKTGGQPDDASFGSLLTAEVGRRYSPYSPSSLARLSFYTLANHNASVTPPSSSSSSPYLNSNSFRLTDPLYSHFQIDSGLSRRDTYAPYTGPGGRIVGTGNSSVELPVLPANASVPVGIDYFVEKNNIVPGNAFLTILISFAMVFGVLLVFCFLCFGIASLLRRTSKHSQGSVASWSYRFIRLDDFFGSFCRAVFGRFMMISWQVILVFAFFQWMNGDSWVGHLLGAVAVAVFLLGFFLLFFPTFRYARRGSRDDLFYGETPPAVANPVAKRWGAAVQPFRPAFFWFGLVLVLVAFIRACFVGFVQGVHHGLRQSAGLAAADVLLFFVLCICRPGRDKTSDFVMIVLAVFRIISWGICIAFTPQANIRTIPRVVVGFGQIAFTGLPIVFLFFVTVWDLVSPFLRKNQWRAVNVLQQQQQPPQLTFSPLEMEAYAFGSVGAIVGGGNEKELGNQSKSNQYPYGTTTTSSEEPWLDPTLHRDHSSSSSPSSSSPTDGFNQQQETTTTSTPTTHFASPSTPQFEMIQNSTTQQHPTSSMLFATAVESNQNQFLSSNTITPTNNLPTPTTDLTSPPFLVPGGYHSSFTVPTTSTTTPHH